MPAGHTTRSWYLARRLVCVAMMVAGALNLDFFLDPEKPLAQILGVIWFAAAVFWFVFPWMMRWGWGPGPRGWGGGGGDGPGD